MTTIQQVIRDGALSLADAGHDSPRLDAEVLMRHVLSISRTELFMRYPESVDGDALVRFHALIERRLAGDPVAYITGEREFMGLSFIVGPEVLVPRPETELLVEWALRHLQSRPGATVVDVGTGSGAIAASVAMFGEGGPTVIATDVSPVALDIAQRNASALVDDDRRARISFREGSLLAPIDEQVTLVLANLPYLTPGQIEDNPDLAAEPELALDGGADGLDLIRNLVASLHRVLVPGGGVALEIDPAQQAETERLLRDAFPGRSIHTIHDLAGLARHVVLEPELPA